MTVNLQNPCEVDKYAIPNSCAPDFEVDRASYEAVARSTCPLLSKEWKYTGQNLDQAQPCRYESQSGWRAVPGTPNGKQIVCQRESFTGDRLTCSLQNYESTQNRADCFSDSQQQNTCPPDTLSAHLPGAQQQIFNYCTGADLAAGDSTWTRRWDQGQGCVEAIEYNLFQPPNSSVLWPPVNIRQPGQAMSPAFFVNAEGFEFSRTLMTGAYERYTSDGFTVGRYPGQVGFNPWQNVAYGLCQNVPGICQDVLDRSCTAVTQQQLAIQPYLAPFCGCYMPEPEYRQYINQWGLTKECTPFCNLPTAIPPAAPGGTQQQFCNQDVCVIDDFTVNLINTEVGAVNINQICGGCSSSTCTCLVNGVSVNGYDSRIQGSISLNQDCQSQQCSVFNPVTQQYVNVPCSDSGDSSSVLSELQMEQEQAQRWTRFKTFVIWGVGLIIVVGLVLLMAWLEGKIEANKLPSGAVGRTAAGHAYGVST